MNRDRVRRASFSLQGWLGIAAVLGTVACLYAAFAAPTREVAEGQALTGFPLCSSGSSTGAGKLDSSFRTDHFAVFYTDRAGDCNQVSSAQAKRAGGALERARGQILALGVRPPKEPIDVSLWREPKNGGLQVYDSRGGRGALVLDGEASQLAAFASRGYAELALAQAAPGLGGAARRRVGFALAVLASGDAGTVRGTAESLNEGVGSDAADGLYVAWLAARLGPGFLRATVADCRVRCDYAAVRDREVAQRGLNPRRELDRFTAAAVAPGARAAFKRRLLQP